MKSSPIGANAFVPDASSGPPPAVAESRQPAITRANQATNGADAKGGETASASDASDAGRKAMDMIKNILSSVFDLIKKAMESVVGAISSIAGAAGAAK